ncbi:MAG TPA: HAD-IA family hydrolase [Candidatus Nanoarchaeia archaeon]|nr:HAD-IA family hydrolase [Candidatus Nanoarchaeia archaeon]
MFTAILFDLDNTLIDFMTMKRASSEAAITAMLANGIEIEKEKATKILFELYDEFGWEYNLIFQRFLERVQKDVDYKTLAAAIISYRKAQQAFMEPYPKVIPTLLEIKKRGIKLAIVTDAPQLKAWMRLTELKLQDFFDVVVAFGQVPETKPSKLPFQKALDLLKEKPENVLMVGDMPHKDIAGAKAVGIKTCFAKYGCTLHPLPKTNADYEIDAIEEIIDIIKKKR